MRRVRLAGIFIDGVGCAGICLSFVFRGILIWGHDVSSSSFNIPATLSAASLVPSALSLSPAIQIIDV